MQALPQKYRANIDIQKYMEIALCKWEIHKIPLKCFVLLRGCNYRRLLPKDTLQGPTILVRLLTSADYMNTIIFRIHKEDGVATQFLKGGSEQT